MSSEREYSEEDEERTTINDKDEEEDERVDETDSESDEEGTDHPELLGAAAGAISHYATQLIRRLKSAQVMAGEGPHGAGVGVGGSVLLRAYPSYIAGPLAAQYKEMETHEKAIVDATEGGRHNWYTANLLSDRPHGLRPPHHIQPVRFSSKFYCKTLHFDTPLTSFKQWLDVGRTKTMNGRGVSSGISMLDVIGTHTAASNSRSSQVDGLVPMHVCIQQGGVVGIPREAGVSALGLSFGTTSPNSPFEAWSKSQVLHSDSVSVSEQKELEATSSTSGKVSVNVLAPVSLVANIGGGLSDKETLKEHLKDAPRVTAGEEERGVDTGKIIYMDSAVQPLVPYKCFEEDGLVFVGDRTMFAPTPEAAVLLSVPNLVKELELGVKAAGDSVIISATADRNHPGHAQYLAAVIALNHIHELLEGKDANPENLRAIVYEETSKAEEANEPSSSAVEPAAAIDDSSTRIYIRAPRAIWESIVRRYLKLFSRSKHVMEVVPGAELTAQWAPYVVGGAPQLVQNVMNRPGLNVEGVQSWVDIKILYRTLRPYMSDRESKRRSLRRADTEAQWGKSKSKSKGKSKSKSRRSKSRSRSRSRSRSKGRSRSRSTSRNRGQRSSTRDKYSSSTSYAHHPSSHRSHRSRSRSKSPKSGSGGHRRSSHDRDRDSSSRHHYGGTSSSTHRGAENDKDRASHYRESERYLDERRHSEAKNKNNKNKRSNSKGRNKKRNSRGKSKSPFRPGESGVVYSREEKISTQIVNAPKPKPKPQPFLPFGITAGVGTINTNGSPSNTTFMTMGLTGTGPGSGSSRGGGGRRGSRGGGGGGGKDLIGIRHTHVETNRFSVSGVAPPPPPPPPAAPGALVIVSNGQGSTMGGGGGGSPFAIAPPQPQPQPQFQQGNVPPAVADALAQAMSNAAAGAPPQYTDARLKTHPSHAATTSRQSHHHRSQSRESSSRHSKSHRSRSRSRSRSHSRERSRDRT